MTAEMVSHYRILEKLGEGGMGVVYKAEDTKLKRIVALKFLPSHLTKNETDLARFLQEAQSAAALNHPNVCTIHEIHDEGENPFIVMEYVEGETVRQKTKDKRQNLKEVINYAIQIAEALQAAHAKGIVHRDIKSDNIMITPDGRVKVMDFGLAKLRGSMQLTKSSSTLGTVAYMSPEHLQGQEVDTRTDIFSFGVVLYEMLTGELPFKGEYDSAMMYAIVNEAPEPVQKHRSDLSSELLYVLNRALEKDPEERYQSIKDMLIDLKRLKRDTDKVSEKNVKSVKQFPVNKTADIKKGLKRSPLLIFAVLVVIIAAGSILFYILRSSRDPVSGHFSWKNSIAVLPFDDASPQQDQEYFCDGMTEEVITHLARNRELKVISKTSVDYFKESDQSLQTIGRKLDVNNILEGSIRKQGDMIRVTARLIDLENDATLWTDSFDKKLENIFEVQEEVAIAISEALQIRFIPPDNTSKAMKPEVQQYYLRSMDAISTYLLSRQVKDFEQAVSMANRALEIDPDNALIYTALAWIYNNRYSLTGDFTYRKPVIRYCIRAYQLNPNLAQTKAGMAYALFSQEQFKQAAYYMQQALKLNPNIAEINHITGWMCYYSGLEDKAIIYFRKAAELNPFYLFTPAMLGSSYRNCGRFSQAEAVFRKALDLSLFSPNLNLELAELLIINNNLDEAEIYLKRAMESPYLKQYQRSVKALLYAARGDRKEALSVEDISNNKKGLLYAFLDMKEKALTCLEAGSETSYLRLINHPFYDSLREEERYKAVLEKLKERYDRMNSIFKDV